MRQTIPPVEPPRNRRVEVIRPAAERREFGTREAQRALQAKERSWAPVAYGILFGVAAVVLFFAYTAYAFSAYRGEILPGVRVDSLSLGELTPSQAQRGIIDRLTSIYFVPIRLTYGQYHWSPGKAEIGLGYDVPATVAQAMSVGRTESFPEQLLDRTPLHPDHPVPLLYHLNEVDLKAYIRSAMAAKVSHPAVNARLVASGDGFLLVPSKPGAQLDVSGTESIIHDALGSLSIQVKPVPVVPMSPAITDSAARSVLARVNAFLDHPPVLSLGRRVLVTDRATFVPMISFHDQVHPAQHSAAIVMSVNRDAVSTFVAKLATSVNRPARDAVVTFYGGHAQVVQPQVTGRSLDTAGAVDRLVALISALKPNGRLHLRISVVQPPIDLSNPASLGIRTLLGAGETSFSGAGDARLTDILNIAKVLNGDLISPNQDVSFNTLAGTDWPNGVYADRETERGGQLVPADTGAMQQVATTFLRALYAAGLKLEERHPHPYILPWYSNPLGLDAVVDPSNGEDLRFRNDTGKYLLIQTRVEPVRQELFIYVYGPQLGWRVSVDKVGKVLRTIPHPPATIRQDPTLAPGQVQQVAWAHDGAVVVIQRTIAFPNGDVRVTQLTTRYRPWGAVKVEGMAPAATAVPSATAQPTTTPGPTPTPTFNH